MNNELEKYRTFLNQISVHKIFLGMLVLFSLNFFGFHFFEAKTIKTIFVTIGCVFLIELIATLYIEYLYSKLIDKSSKKEKKEGYYE